MVLIILLILSQDASFNASIHKLERPKDDVQNVYFLDACKTLKVALTVAYSYRWAIGKAVIWKWVDADYFVPDGLASDKDIVFYLGWKYASNLDKREEIATMYASAMSAIAPELEDAFFSSMEGRYIHPQRIFIPSTQAHARRILLNEHDKYGPDETLVLFGTGLQILYVSLIQQVDIQMMQEVNYNKFVTNSINALGRKLDMSDGVLSRLKFPLALEKAQAVKRVFGVYNDLKARIIRYLMSACDQKGNLSIVGSYMCEILAWSEMSVFVSIKEMLYASNSPVLQDISIKHEVKAFYYIMKKIDKSVHPQFFRYFCNGLDDMYVEKNNFPILAQVAQTLKSDEVRGSSSEQFVAKPKVSSPMVGQLVSLHQSYVTLRKIKSTSNVSKV
ncbi:hypothetical protein L2E82_32715 [Cichorium intybus]|uniref:Uncharacterized protein n=1 Tax=Cichorium intybus TaxID=13427 RepID=A0ACB9BH44_CICIN|nr:hypothetical protein L2E82_32715 [Cichorium intybus]